jgi:hypothetical protein
MGTNIDSAFHEEEEKMLSCTKNTLEDRLQIHMIYIVWLIKWGMKSSRTMKGLIKRMKRLSSMNNMLQLIVVIKRFMNITKTMNQ